ncbi:MAG: hypothetical protein H7Y38_17895 [Armatimonadetes bacterium]|nr:hypothetical protein [Armatimonadota bacterium]
MVIEFVKGESSSNKRDVVRIIRTDGTTAYTYLHPYFPLHDLLHYVVETELELHESFWGLLARGWHFDDFATKNPATGKLLKIQPEQALAVEELVGFLQLAETGSVSRDPADLQRLMGEQSWVAKISPMGIITSESIGAIQNRFAALRKEWTAIASGDVLKLVFPYHHPAIETILY